MKRIRVSDHAVLRYLERHGGFEIEKLREQIAARIAPFAATGAEHVRCDGLVFVIRGEDPQRVVTTVVEAARFLPKDPRDG